MTNGDAQEWLAHASGDVRYARLGQSDPELLANLIVFHARQAVEKALKAVLVAFRKEFPRTHDLEQLVELIEEAGVNWPADFDGVRKFTPFATLARYPGFGDPITPADVEEAVRMAEKMVAWARGQVAEAQGSEFG